jgi:hypothetical protein
MDAIDRAITLVNQYRYVEAYDLVENADVDEATKNLYLIEIAHKQKQHLVNSLPQPFTAVPHDLAELPVRLWLRLPYVLTGFGLSAIVIYLNSQSLTPRELGFLFLLTLGGWFIGKVITRDQIKRAMSSAI